VSVSNAGPLYLALDQGGHASRALVYDRTGRAVARATMEVGVARLDSDRVEQDGEELARSLAQVARDALASLGPNAKRVVAAGLATQRASIACWDRETGATLGPVLSWQDRRAAARLDALHLDIEMVQRVTGLRPSAHYGASKLAWCLENLPPVSQAAAEGRLAFGPLASFLVFRLTREKKLLADPANAQRTLLYDVYKRHWNADLAGFFAIPLAALPRAVTSRHTFGNIEAGPATIPLEFVTGDQSAALFAFGNPAPNTLFVNLGTGAFLQRLAPAVATRSGLLRSIAADDGARAIYTQEGTVNGAGAALAWYAKERGIADIEARLTEWLDAVHTPPFFLNGVSGLGSPWWVPDFPIEFVRDAEAETGPAAETVAILESIVFLLMANIEAAQKDGEPVQRIVATGGLARVDGLCQRLANLAGIGVARPAETEATARGLAWLLAAEPRYWPEEKGGAVFEPQPDDALRARYRRWRQLIESRL
jgi:glycerol kinase